VYDKYCEINITTPHCGFFSGISFVDSKTKNEKRTTVTDCANDRTALF